MSHRSILVCSVVDCKFSGYFEPDKPLYKAMMTKEGMRCPNCARALTSRTIEYRHYQWAAFLEPWRGIGVITLFTGMAFALSLKGFFPYTRFQEILLLLLMFSLMFYASRVTSISILKKNDHVPERLDNLAWVRHYGIRLSVSFLIVPILFLMEAGLIV